MHEDLASQFKKSTSLSLNKQLVGSIGEKTGITLNFDISQDTLEEQSPWLPCSSATNSEFDDCLYSETTKALLQEFGCRHVVNTHFSSITFTRDIQILSM